MGHQATVVLHLDDINKAKQNPQQFAEELVDTVLNCANGINTLGYTFGHKSGAHGEVLNVHHSDDCSLVLTGGNTGVKVCSSYGYAVTDLEVQQRVLKEALKEVQSKLKIQDNKE